MLREEGRIYTRGLTDINSGYYHVTAAAETLVRSGLVVTDPSLRYSNGKVWRLTEEGKQLAAKLYDLELTLRSSYCSGNNYKWGPNRGF